MAEQPGTDEGQSRESEPMTLGQTIGSVLASFFGVQSRRNRERDFTRGRPIVFIATGILATMAFIFILIVAVRLTMRSAGVS